MAQRSERRATYYAIVLNGMHASPTPPLGPQELHVPDRNHDFPATPEDHPAALVAVLIGRSRTTAASTASPTRCQVVPLRFSWARTRESGCAGPCLPACLRVELPSPLLARRSSVLRSPGALCGNVHLLPTFAGSSEMGTCTFARACPPPPANPCDHRLFRGVTPASW